MSAEFRRRALAILQEMRSLDAPSRQVDFDIAELMGFERRQAEKVIWLGPDGQVAKIPRYTSMIDHAHILANDLLPGHVGAIRWEQGGGSAQIEPGPAFHAANHALALCMAAFYVYLSQKHQQQPTSSDLTAD